VARCPVIPDKRLDRNDKRYSTVPNVPIGPRILQLHDNHILLGTDMTTSELIRRDPQKGKNGFSKARGFTVIELLVAVGVFAIIASLAMPSYMTLLEKRRLTSSAEQITAFLSAAKMEAIKRHNRVSISADEDAWCMGFTSYAANASDAGCDCTVTDPAGAGACSVVSIDDGAPELKVLQSGRLANLATLEGVSMGGSDDMVVFDPIRGMLVEDDTVASPLEIQLTSTDATYAMNVGISATGRVWMCSDSDRAEISVPGYDDC